MASGINGPGGQQSPEEMSQNGNVISKVISNPAPNEQPVRFHVSFDGEDTYSPAPAQITGSRDALPVPTDGGTDSHLNFANLMAMQNQFEPASAIRRCSASANQPDSVGMYPNKPYKKSSHLDDIEKVFDHGSEKSSSSSFNVQLDFGDPDMAAEVSQYQEQRFSEGDYSSHRRSSRHHSKPLVSHLSSHELKSIKSRATTAASEGRSKRRRHRSSSSSSSHGSGSTTPSKSDAPSQEKIKRGKKKKKGVRKSLTAKVRQRTLSIPEEDEGDEEVMQGLENDLEEESEEEEEEEEDEDEEFDSTDADGKEGEGPDDDKGGDSNSRRQSEDNDGDSSPKENEATSHESNVVHEVQGAGNVKMIAKFSVGDDDDSRVDLQPVTSLVTTKPSIKDSGEKSARFLQVPGKSSDDDFGKTEKGKKKRRHAHQKRKQHRHDSIDQRRASGLQLRELDKAREELRKKSMLDSDTSDMDKSNLENIQSHRYDEHPGIRKHLLHRPVKKRRTRRSELEEKVIADRQPHEVFVELDELVSGEWKETARWIKFEEDVEESQQWGKPRVASLSFHSLLELRRTIEKGAVVLDLDNDNLTDIANSVVEQMVRSDQIRAEDRGSVLKVLLSKHKHLAPQTGLAYSLSQASFGSFLTSSVAKIEDETSSVSYTNTSAYETKQPLLNVNSNIDVEKGKTGESTPKVGSPSTRDFKIMKKIPKGAEATAVLVGCVEYLEQPTMAFVRLSTGVDLENVVALPIPVRFIFVLLGPSKDDFDYHEIGRSISTLMADEEFHVIAYQAETRGDLLRAINEFLDDSIVLPPGQLENPELLRNIARYQKNLAQRAKKKQLALAEKEPSPPPDDPLRRTRNCFGGLIRDVKRRYPLYLSDITDAFNAQCLASFIFIYFAALSPAITFGGLLGEKTGGLMGVSEMVVGCCFCGCMMALFSGQPFLIVGSTGPLLVFEEAVYQFCMSNGLPFLSTRVWVGLWICIIALLCVAFEGSFLIRFVSRFTQEIFAALISLIFIYETFNKLFKIFGTHPLLSTYPDAEALANYTSTYNCTVEETFIETQLGNGTNNNSTNTAVAIINQPNTALLSTLLMFGTYLIAMNLRNFRNSKFLRSSVRRTIGDFGVPIAIFAMVLLDFLIADTYTQKLNIPKGLSPTKPEVRGWFINPLEENGVIMPIWMMFGAALPAFLVFILIFMESHITELIISKKERRLKKGTGFHLNLLVLGVLNGVVSLFGLPWVCAAAVRSITHTNSLTVMSKTLAPGEKPRIEATIEQRMTCFSVNAALGLSILMQPILKEIPIAVLFGIFLYMGVTSLAGVQFIDRLVLLFMPAKHYPDYNYVKTVRPLRIHIFTIIEFACLVILWVVKSTPASIAFPFFLLLTVPLRRFLLPKIFTKKELSELDNEGGDSSSNQDDFADDVLRPD